MESAESVLLLDSTNWERWKVEIKVLLMHYGAWVFIEDPKYEEKFTESCSLKLAEGASGPVPWKEKCDFDLRKNRAYTIIFQNLSAELKPLISNTTSGSQAWKILNEHFEPTTRARIIQLLDDFFNTRYEPDEDVGLFLCRVKRAAERLQDVGHQLPSLYKGYQMIRSLPAEFQSIVQSIYRWKDNEFVPDKIESELLLEENRIKLSSKDYVSGTQMFSSETCTGKPCFDVKNVKSFKKVYNVKQNDKVKGSNVNKSNFKCVNDKSRIGPCYRCGNYGHFKANCRVLSKNLSKLKETSNVETVKSNFDVNVAFSENNLTEFSRNRQIETNVLTTSGKQTNWVFDTAATAHFCNNKSLYLDFEPVANLQMSLAVGEKESFVEGKGTIKFYVKIGKTYNEITLKNVLYNPNLRRNLISGSKLESQGSNFSAKDGKVTVYNSKGQQIFYAVRRGNLYFLNPSKYVTHCKGLTNSANLATEVATKDTISLWHERFCHINVDYMVKTSKNNSVRGLPTLTKLKDDCIPCKLAKSKRISFKPIKGIRSKYPLQLLHLDLCGPLQVPTEGGNRYFLTIVDDFSRKVTVYLLKHKSDVFQTFLRFTSRAERFLNRKVVAIRTDGGMEFCSKDFESFLEKQGISHEKTNPFSPEMNGTAERFHLTALDGVKTMLKSSGLAQRFWGEALYCFTYVWNRICHKSNKTPFELYCNRKPSVSHLKTFGCLAYVGIPKQNRKKLDMRAKLGIMLGYAQRTKGYRIWLIDDRKLIETINVNFNENKRGVDFLSSRTIIKYPKFRYETPEYDDDEPSLDFSKLTQSQSSVEPSQKSDESSLKSCLDVPWVRDAVPRNLSNRTDIYYRIEGTNVRCRSLNDVRNYCDKNKIQFNGQLFDFSSKNLTKGKIADLNSDSTISENEASLIEIQIPKNYNEAIKLPEASEWEKAMNQEMQVMYDRNVWELVQPPVNKKVLGNRWVFTVKRNEKNEIMRYKARLVVQGFEQVKGQNYDEVFSPVVNFSIIRLFFSIFSCFFKWFNMQIDIDNAYLYADLSEEIFMQQPEGFSRGDGRVCRLKRALYGLHQSSREWFYEMDKVLSELGFQKLNWCNCVYVYLNNLVLLLYVDDIVLFGKSEEELQHGINLIQSSFSLKILGETRKLLGIEFEKKDGKLFIHQESYINKVCDMFLKYKYTLSSVPISRGEIFSKLDCPSNESELNDMKDIPYRSLVGCLAFIANRTRPDILYAVNLFSQFQSNPGFKHWNGLLKLLGYVKNTQSYKLELSKVTNLSLTCFSDSDFAANRDDRVSMGGYIIFLDETPVSWRTFKQKCISLSTMEAEYVSLTEAAKELLWLKNVILSDSLNLTLEKCLLLCDNQAAISFSNSPFENHRTKHIHIKYHFLRKLVFDKVFELKYVTSKNNLADPFTKPQIKEEILKFCNQIFQM